MQCRNSYSGFQVLNFGRTNYLALWHYFLNLHYATHSFFKSDKELLTKKQREQIAPFPNLKLHPDRIGTRAVVLKFINPIR